MRLRIGTRGSELALKQAGQVAGALKSAAGIECELVIVKTSGDRDRSTALNELTTQGFFTKELERVLLEGGVDLAVHSFKDLPTAGPEGLFIAAVPERADPRDVILCRKDSLDSNRGSLPLKTGARVATGSNRRRAQLKRQRPDLELVDLRGNVPTRLEKLKQGEFDAMVAAKAALDRLGSDLSGYGVRILAVEEFVPAPAQGAIAVQARCGSKPSRLAAECMDHSETRIAVTAERRLMSKLEGGCQLPLGVNARKDRDSGDWILAASSAPRPKPGQPPAPASGVIVSRGLDLDDLVEQAYCELAPLVKQEA